MTNIDRIAINEEPEREWGITISSNPHYSPDFGKSALTAAVSAVINKNRRSHQRKRVLQQLLKVNL